MRLPPAFHFPLVDTVRVRLRIWFLVPNVSEIWRVALERHYRNPPRKALSADEFVIGHAPDHRSQDGSCRVRAHRECATHEEFAREWDAPETDIRMLWQLLGQLEEEELLIEIPEWLAEENTGYVDGAIPTAFIGRIAEETEKAIRFTDSADARSLMKLAHRIHELERNEDDPDRNEWLDRRLEKHRASFEEREDAVTLKEEWLPKSQLKSVVRRG